MPVTVFEDSGLLAFQRLQMWLIALFTVLQCMAPLVHAHVDGINSDSAIHAHELRLHAPLTQDTYISLDYVQQADAAVIELPHEFQRNHPLSPDQAPLPDFSLKPEAKAAITLTVHAQSRTLHLRSTPYFLPEAQAPPA
jgi:hypothetical protein